MRLPSAICLSSSGDLGKLFEPLSFKAIFRCNDHATDSTECMVLNIDVSRNDDTPVILPLAPAGLNESVGRIQELQALIHLFLAIRPEG